MWIEDFNYYYKWLAVLRVVLVFIPQYGYIHPDEFLQSTEILAERTFNVDSNLPWEFTTTSPIRSMTIPYFTIGLAYKLLNILNHFISSYTRFSIVCTYTLVVVPRLLMCLLSFLVDYSIYKICVVNNEKYKSKLIILASSYVMLVYGTRTFSNTMELIIFALLLYFVVDSMTFTNDLVRKSNFLNYRYNKSKTPVEKAKYHKLRRYLSSDVLHNCFYVASLSVMGFFNRPTFISFAVFPVFFWLFRGLGAKTSLLPLKYHIRMSVWLLSTVPTVLFFVTVDSLFYYFLTWGEIGVLNVSIDNFVFTPLNFMLYNLKADNLAQHGVHPKFLHALFNVPLLFNVLGISALYMFAQYINWITRYKIHLLPTIRTIKCVMILSFLAPLCALSCFNHQEPRFLIPLLVPLVYLYSEKVLPEPDTILIKPEAEGSNGDKSKENSQLVFKLWLFFNAICFVFYGFIHQGGVYQVANHLSNDLQLRPKSTQFHVVTSYIYPIPETWFLQKPSERLHFKWEPFDLLKRLHLHEKNSRSFDLVLRDAKHIMMQSESHAFKKSVIYIIVPSCLENHVYEMARKEKVQITLEKTFYPHVATEVFRVVINEITMECMHKYDLFTIFNCAKKIGSSFGLSLYKFTRVGL